MRCDNTQWRKLCLSPSRHRARCMIVHREINISGVCVCFEPAFTSNIDIKFTVYHVHELTPCYKTFHRRYTVHSQFINPLNPELNPICYLLALLGAHHFIHVSRIRVKLLTFRRLLSYIYMEHPFLMFLDHTQRRSTVGRTPLDE